MTLPTSLGGAEHTSSAAHSAVPTGCYFQHVLDGQRQAGESALWTKVALRVAW